jgi:hypothetical protein
MPSLSIAAANSQSLAAASVAKDQRYTAHVVLQLRRMAQC